MPLSKWLSGGHIGFFGSPINGMVSGHKSSLLRNFNFKLRELRVHIDCAYGQKPVDFQRHHFQNGRLVAILDFFSFEALTLVWHWISTQNFNSILLVSIDYRYKPIDFEQWHSNWPPIGQIGFFWFLNYSLAHDINSQFYWLGLSQWIEA